MAITFTNKGRTTLHASVTSGDVVFTIPVADVGKLPSSGQYDLAIENEYVTVTGGQGTSSLTVTRHQYGTTAAGYSAGTALVETVTAAELALFLQSDQAVTSLDVSGGTGATGDVRLAAGTDIDLARTGQVITVSLVSGAATAGQVLEADGGGSAAWADLPASFANPMSAQDDLIVGGTAGAATRLGSTASRYLITDSSGHVGWRQPTLGADTDVAISSPSAGQVLTYDSGTSTWENQTPSPSFANPMTAPNDLILGGTAGAATRLATANSRYLITDSSGVVGWRQPTLGADSDVALSSPSNGQVLTYDSGTGKWENQTPSAGSSTLAADTDVAISSPSNGQVLTYDSGTSTWKNQTSSAGSTTLAADTDVALSSPTNGQVLTYDTATGKWKNAAPAAGGYTGGDLTVTGRLNDFQTPPSSINYGLVSLGNGLFDGSAGSFLGLGAGTVIAINMLAISTYQQTVLLDTPVLYYRIGEAGGATTAADLGSAAVPLTYASGVTAITSGATNDGDRAKQPTTYVAKATYSSVRIGNAAGTWECWIKNATAGAVVGWGYDSSPGSNGSSIVLGSTSQIVMHMMAGSGTNDYNNIALNASGKNFNDGSWHHIVVTHDGTHTLKLYVDGALADTNNYNPAGGSNNDPTSGTWWVGGSNNGSHGSSQTFSGQIDESAYYSTVLTATQILAHYTAAAMANSYVGDWIRAEAGGSTAFRVAGTGDITAGLYNGVTPFGNPMTAAGDLVVGGASGAATRVAAPTHGGAVLYYDNATSKAKWLDPGTSGYVLQTNGNDAAPSWVASSGGGGSSTLAGDTDVAITSPSNGQVLTYDSGTSTWKNQAAATGGTGQATLTAPPAASALTWFHQNSATLTDDASGVKLRNTGTANQPSGATKSLSGTYDFKCALSIGVDPSAAAQAGLMITDGTKAIVFTFIGNQGTTPNVLMLVERWSTSTSFSADSKKAVHNILSPYIWLRIQNDGTNNTFSWSQDGLQWEQFYQEGATAFLTATAAGLVVIPNSSVCSTWVRAHSWAGV